MPPTKRTLPSETVEPKPTDAEPGVPDPDPDDNPNLESIKKVIESHNDPDVPEGMKRDDNGGLTFTDVPWKGYS